MINYLLRRVVYGILILLGVNLITFVLFFAVNTPDDMARLNLGGRRVTADAIEAWKAARGLDKPLFINTAAEGVQKITDTVFFERSVPLLFFDFGRSDSGRDIGYEISTRMWPSLALAVPTFLLGLIVMVAWSLLVVLFRRTRVEAAAIGLSVFLMSISSLFYIIVGQWLFSKLMRLFPISGWADGWGCTAFLVLPVLIALFRVWAAIRSFIERCFSRKSAATMFVRHAPRGYLKAQYCGVMCSEMLRFPSSPRR